MMLNLMPILPELHTKEIIPTSRGTNNGVRHIFSGGLDACNSHASDFPWRKITSKQTALVHAECWYEQEELPQA
jgi:hypothetical protein